MNVRCRTTLKGMFASQKKIVHFLSKSCFLAKFNPSSNETCRKVQVFLFVDLLKPSVLFVRGESLNPFHLRRQSRFSFN